MTYKTKPEPCRCEAYPFPHRIDSKACKELYNNTPDDDINYTMSRDQRAANDAGVDGRYFL